MRAFASQSTGAVPFHRDPASPASRLRRNIPPNFAEPSRRRNGEPVSPLTPKPALFAFSFYGSNLTPAVQPIAGGQGKLHYTPTSPARNSRKTGR